MSGLTAGTHYNLYEYELGSVTGLGSAAALPVPTSAWNAASSKATFKLPFVASGPTFTYEPTPFASSATVVFRAVPASAP